MTKLTITRPSYNVLRNGEKIGKIQPGPFGWMAVDNSGKPDHYYPCTTQREAAARVETLFDRQAAQQATTDTASTDETFPVMIHGYVDNPEQVREQARTWAYEDVIGPIDRVVVTVQSRFEVAVDVHFKNVDRHASNGPTPIRLGVIGLAL